MLVIHASGCEDRHFYFFLLLMEPSISQSHRLSLGFGLADNKPPFSLTFHRPLGNRPGSMGTGHKQKIPLLGPTHLGWFFSFLISPMRLLEDLGAGLALLLLEDLHVH